MSPQDKELVALLRSSTVPLSLLRCENDAAWKQEVSQAHLHFTVDKPISALAHFEGPFTEDEQHRILQALRAAEATLERQLFPSWAGKPWVVTSIEGPQTGRTLLAHRLGTNRPLVAPSVDDLVVQMTNGTISK